MATKKRERNQTLGFYSHKPNCDALFNENLDALFLGKIPFGIS